MNKKIFISAILFILFGHAFSKEAFSWTEGTHMNLSEYAAEKSALSKSNDDYLKNFGFDLGLDEVLAWQGKNWTVTKWLREGAKLEDAGSLSQLAVGNGRSFNHFHNPIKQFPWTDAGLDDWIVLPPFHTTGQSSLLWAQDETNQENFSEGNWSWQKIREHYYAALTGKDFNGNVVAPDEAMRKEYFARTFRGLGHQMHLIQDAAQPDHVRNDAHPEDTYSGIINSIGFEKWAGEKFYEVDALKTFAPTPIFPNVPFNISYNNLSPITQLFDTDTYDGYNASAGINQGMAEYTNANFFSNDTIFAAERYSTDHRHYFPYPKKSSTDLQSYIDENRLPEVVIGEDNIPDTSFWIKKERDGESIIEHFIKPGYFTRHINPFTALYYRTFYRDEKCHEDYASLLIPRAVGYSAGPLDYFFRGRIYLVEHPDYANVYKIKNASSENMDGLFELYYDDDNGQRKFITSWQGLIPANSEGGSIVITSFPSDFPEGKKGECFLVFKGKMGNEEGAVIGHKDKIGDLGSLGYYVKRQSGSFFGTTDGSFSNCQNSDLSFLGALTNFSLGQFYQKKFKNGTNSFYIIKQRLDPPYSTTESDHKIFIYEADKKNLINLTGFYTSDVYFNVSEDLQNIYVATGGGYGSNSFIMGEKYVKVGNNWIKDKSQTWSFMNLKMGYVKKDGLVVATRLEKDSTTQRWNIKQKITLDIETGNITVIDDGLYLQENVVLDGAYTNNGCTSHSCFVKDAYGYEHGCGYNCALYMGSTGSGNRSTNREDFIYHRSGGAGDFIEDLKTREISDSITYKFNSTTHYGCSEIDDYTCSRSMNQNRNDTCETNYSYSFLGSVGTGKRIYNLNSAYSNSSDTCTWGGGIVCSPGQVSSSYSCDWAVNGTSLSILKTWSGKNHWKYISKYSETKTRTGPGSYGCFDPSLYCQTWDSIDQLFLGTYETEVTTIEYIIETPSGSISLGTGMPDKFTFFFLEDAYENNYIEGLKYYLNGAWYIVLYKNGSPIDLTGCIGCSAEELQFLVLLD